MATQPVRALEIAVGPLYSWESHEKPGETYKKGAVLVYDTTAPGLLREASADPPAIVGLALRDGQNKTGSANIVKTQFAPILPGTIIEGNLVGSATSLTYIARASAVGKCFGLIKRTAETLTPWAIDGNEQRDIAILVKVIGLKDASGDANARVYAVVLASRSSWLHKA